MTTRQYRGGAQFLAWGGDPAEAVAAADGDDAARRLLTWLTRATPAWHQHAACAGTPVEMFFPPRGRPTAPAKAICATCPVIAECLDDALADPTAEMGIRGGLSAPERTALRLAATTGTPTRRAGARRDHPGNPSNNRHPQ